MEQPKTDHGIPRERKTRPKTKTKYSFCFAFKFRVSCVGVGARHRISAHKREKTQKRKRKKKGERRYERASKAPSTLLSQRQISLLSFFKKYRIQAPTTTTTTTHPFTHHAPHAQRRRGGTGDREQRARRSQKEARTWARTHTKNLAFPFSTHREQRGYKREKSA
jgi:hypothetical protein